MTQVHFLHSAPDRIAAAADWLAQAWSRREAVTVFAPQAELADRLDRQLWLQPATGFIPHCRANSPLAAETPIVITDSPAAGAAILLNLADQLPPDFASFGQLVEIISTDESVRLSARARVKLYKEDGHDIQYQDLSRGR